MMKLINNFLTVAILSGEKNTTSESFQLAMPTMPGKKILKLTMFFWLSERINPFFPTIDCDIRFPSFISKLERKLKLFLRGIMAKNLPSNCVQILFISLISVKSLIGLIRSFPILLERSFLYFLSKTSQTTQLSVIGWLANHQES